MARKRAVFGWVALLVLVVAASAPADSILLDDGQVVEGTVVSQSKTQVTIETASGRRTYRMRRVKSIIRDADVRLPRDVIPAAVLHFYNVDPLSREIQNAEALYTLAGKQDGARRRAKYKQVLERLQPLVHPDDESEEQYELRWMVIETHERLADFKRAVELLEEMEKKGRKTDKLRAKAHLDILEENEKHANPWSLRTVNGRKAADFMMNRDDVKRAKEANSLADAGVMRVALEEYCFQILENQEVSIRALKKKLDVEDTLDALLEVPPRARDVTEYLPFSEELVAVEESLDRVDAILPDYATGYRAELARILGNHFLVVLDVLFAMTVETHPEPKLSGDRSGRMTADERRTWREYCDEFELALRPLMLTAKYMQDKLAPHPSLRTLNVLCQDVIAQLEQARKTIVTKKGQSSV